MPVGTITFQVTEDKLKLSIEFIFMIAPPTVWAEKIEQKVHVQDSETLGYVAHLLQCVEPLLSIFFWDSFWTMGEFWLYSFHTSTKKWEMK